MNKSICLDLHGIITANPNFFAMLTQSLKKDGWSIHVATGSHIEESKIVEELEGYGIAYTHLFSIADYHRKNKTPGMWYDDKGDPWVSDEDWDKTKARYCKENNISFCIDDTARYARYFDTPFGYMSIQNKKEQPNKYLEFIIDNFKKRSQKTILRQFENWFNKKFGSFFCPPGKLGKENQNRIYK